MHKYSLPELKRIAEELAENVVAPYSIFLEGGLGVGKTTFSQFFIQKLIKGGAQAVVSPTFNIVQIYDTTKGSVWHVDLYRVKDPREIFEFGLLEAIHECICLIEWPQILLSDIFKQYTTNCNHTLLDLSV